MFKVTEIAEMFGVSRQNIYYWIDKLRDNELKEHIFKRDGASVVDIEGVKILQGKMDITEDVTDIFTEDNKQQDIQQGTNAEIKELRESIKKLESNYTELVTTLQKQLEKKDEQLAIKDQQLAKKDELLERNNDLLQNFQVLVRENQERITELEGDVQEQKKGIFSRLKWWSKN